MVESEVNYMCIHQLRLLILILKLLVCIRWKLRLLWIMRKLVSVNVQNINNNKRANELMTDHLIILSVGANLTNTGVTLISLSRLMYDSRVCLPIDAWIHLCCAGLFCWLLGVLLLVVHVLIAQLFFSCSCYYSCYTRCYVMLILKNSIFICVLLLWCFNTVLLPWCFH